MEVDGNASAGVKAGKGGYGFIYAAKEMSSGKEFALKIFLVFEESKVAEVFQVIRLMKEVGTDGLREVCYGCKLGPLAWEESE